MAGMNCWFVYMSMAADSVDGSAAISNYLVIFLNSFHFLEQFLSRKNIFTTLFLFFSSNIVVDEPIV